MKHRQKSTFWSLIIISTLLFGASTIGLWKHAARSPTRAAEAKSLSHPANPSTQPNSSSLPGHGVAAATRAETDRQMAIATAEALLRNEKIARSAEVGRTAQESALAAESYTPRDVVLEVDGSQHVRMDRKLRDLSVVGGGIVVHSREGRLLSLTKTLDLQVTDAAALVHTPQPALSQDQAVLAAKFPA